MRFAIMAVMCFLILACNSQPPPPKVIPVTTDRLPKMKSEAN